MNKKSISTIIFTLLLILFTLPRLKVILSKTFPYTYDQGRDFLKVEEIVRYKNPTFIGPTTGIMGLYHGAWWYYYLAVPYILTGGNPLAFAFWIFLTQLAITLLFTLFLKKEFGNIPALLFLTLITFSPYFINMSSFVINSGFTFPFILLFLYSLYKIIKLNKAKYYFFFFLSSGFIWEAEYAFGLFLLPTILILFAIKGKIKEIFLNKRKFLYSSLGLLIPILPRLAFEVRHNFIQTRTLLSFLFKPKLHNPKPLTDAFRERFFQFINFYLSIFPEKFEKILGVIFLIIILYAFHLLRKRKKELAAVKEFLESNLIILFLLFFLSGFYRDNFWGNYYEGIQLFYISLISISFYVILKAKLKYKTLVVYTPVLLLVIAGLISTYKRLKTPFKPGGLYVPEYYVKKLYRENKGKKFCVRVYTPPVIPYTWHYLFKYYSRKLKTPEPVGDFVEGKCYFIIEDEAKGYEFRIEKWREENIPKNSKLLKKQYKYGVTVELRELTRKLRAE